MRRVRGLGGRVFLAADRLPFTAEPLDDAGDGFDWRLRDPARRFWCDDEPLTFEARAPAAADWSPVVPLEVNHLTGRVGFSRCLRGQHVRATGVCFPIAEAVLSETWELTINVGIADATTLEDETARHETTNDRSANAALEACTLDGFLGDRLNGARLLVHLPFRKGAFAGVGVRLAAPDTSDVHVSFDEGKVSYVHC